MPLLLPLLLLVAVVGALDPSIEPEHVFFKANAADLYFQASCTAGPWSNAGEDVWVHDRAGATDIPLAGIVGWDAAAREMGGSIAASTTREAFAAAGQQVHRMQACFALVADDVFAEGTNVKADLFMNGMSRADGWLCGGRLLFLSNGTVLVWTVPVYNAFKFHLMPGAYLDSIWNAYHGDGEETMTIAHVADLFPVPKTAVHGKQRVNANNKRPRQHEGL